MESIPTWLGCIFLPIKVINLGRVSLQGEQQGLGKCFRIFSTMKTIQLFREVLKPSLSKSFGCSMNDSSQRIEIIRCLTHVQRLCYARDILPKQPIEERPKFIIIICQTYAFYPTIKLLPLVSECWAASVSRLLGCVPTVLPVGHTQH